MKYFISIICASLCAMPLMAQNTLSLAECEQLALKNNTQMRAAQLDIDAAVQQKREAFTHYFPAASATAGHFKADGGLLEASIEAGGLIPPAVAGLIPPAIMEMIPSQIPISMAESGTIGSVMALQPVFAGGQIRTTNKLAKVGEQAAELKLDLTRREVVLTTNSYFYSIVNLENKLKTIATVETLLERVHSDVSKALEAGLITRNDLLRVELQMQQVASGRLKVENGIAICKLRLAQFIGVDGNDLEVSYVVPSEITSPSALDRQIDQVEQMVQARVEVDLLDKNIEAAKLRKRLSLGKMLPTVGVGGGYLYNDLLNKSNNSAMFVASVSIPITAWWGGSHNHARHKILEQKAEEERANSIEMMTLETRQVWNELNEAYSEQVLARQSLESANENLRIVDNCYKAGEVPLSELLDAQMLYQESADKLTDAVTVYSLKSLRYRQITE